MQEVGWDRSGNSTHHSGEGRKLHHHSAYILPQVVNRIKEIKTWFCLDYTIVKLPDNNKSGAFSGLWFAGLFVGFILCLVAVILYRRYGKKR